jgi:hypothetical protein
VILGSVQATTELLSGERTDLGSWISLLGAFDVIFLTAGMLVFEYAVGE